MFRINVNGTLIDCRHVAGVFLSGPGQYTIVTHKHGNYSVEGGVLRGYGKFEWFLHYADWSEPIPCRSICAAVRMIEGKDRNLS